MKHFQCNVAKCIYLEITLLLYGEGKHREETWLLSKQYNGVSSSCIGTTTQALWLWEVTCAVRNYYMILIMIALLKKNCLKNARTKCLWLLNRFKLKKTIISITILVSENWATAGKITRQPQWRQLKLTRKAPLILYEQFNCWFCLRSR